MNPPPQENQPGEAAQDSDRPEPQAECHTPPNVTDGVRRWKPTSDTVPFFMICRTFCRSNPVQPVKEIVDDRTWEWVWAEDYDRERAKRLELEGELRNLKKELIEVGNERDNWEANSADWCADHDKQKERAEKAESELLALRGGEGRKVSAAALNWLRKCCEDILAVRAKSPNKEFSDRLDEHLAYARELLCVLSEEGGRQKEGQGDAAGRPVDDASDLNPQNKSDL